VLERFSTITYRRADGGSGSAGHLIAFARKVLALGVEVIQRTDDLTWLTPQPRAHLVTCTLVVKSGWPRGDTRVRRNRTATSNDPGGHSLSAQKSPGWRQIAESM
jgi:hypothetical protein